MKDFGVMALELAKIVKINLVCSVTWTFFNDTSSNLVYQTDNVCWANLCATFNNQPDLLEHWSYGPFLSEIAQINIVHFLIFFNGSS